jgi:hypothetical protein
MLPPLGLIVGAAGALAANAIPAGMQDKISMTASRTARIFPLSLFLKLFFTFLSIISIIPIIDLFLRIVDSATKASF